MYRGIFFFKLLMHMNILSTNGLLNVFFFEILTEYSVTILILQVLSISIMYIISDLFVHLISLKSCFTYKCL